MAKNKWPVFLSVSPTFRYIYKLRSGESTTIFCAQFFANKLKEAVAGGNYETVSSIQNMCSIRMSFIKGWGPGYIRSEITMR